MVRGKGGRVEAAVLPLSNSEREDLLGQKRELEDALKQSEEAGRGTQAEQIDKSAIKRQIAHLDNAINRGATPKVSGIDKDRLVKEAEEIEQTLMVGLPTRDEMDHPGPRNPNAVRKHMRWSEKNAALIERYRYIQRVVNPDEPKSVENLRREK